MKKPKAPPMPVLPAAPPPPPPTASADEIANARARANQAKSRLGRRRMRIDLTRRGGGIRI